MTEPKYRLASHVHVSDDEHPPEVFGPDDEVPQWAAKLITNPKAWAEPRPPWALDGYEGLDRAPAGLTVRRGVHVATAADGREMPVDVLGRPPRFAPHDDLPGWAVEVLRELDPEVVVTFRQLEQLERGEQPTGPWLDVSRRQSGLVRTERADGSGVWAS